MVLLCPDWVNRRVATYVLVTMASSVRMVQVLDVEVHPLQIQGIVVRGLQLLVMGVPFE
jgi:hypothetical protein